MNMFCLLTALFLDGADVILGTRQETRRMLAESRARNEHQRQAVYGIAGSVNHILEESANSGRLLAEQMRNDNLRLEREVFAERRKIESANRVYFPL
jgi:hypothetical protein